MKNKHTVWIIDRQHWPRACLRAELLEHGFDATGYEGITDALRALHDHECERPHIIILELRELAFTNEDLNALAGCGIPVIILGGAFELNQVAVKDHQWASIIQRPFSIGDVVDTIMKL